MNSDNNENEEKKGLGKMDEQPTNLGFLSRSFERNEVEMQ